MFMCDVLLYGFEVLELDASEGCKATVDSLGCTR